MTGREGSIYLDHAAATPVDPRVMEIFLEVESRCPANPSSLHGSGRAARGALDRAREDIADVLGVSPDAVWFVSGGTEANVMAIRGSGPLDRPVLLAPAVEHASVAASARRFRGVEALRIGREGVVEVAPPATPIGLVCLSHAQSEIGTRQPVAELAAVARAAGAPFHVDVAQTLGKIPLGEVLGVADTIAVSAHKAGGLRGASVMVAPRGAPPEPLLVGGGQERGLRAGTPSPALATATAAALRFAIEEQPERARTMRVVLDAFVAELVARAGASPVVDREATVPHIATLRFDGVDGRALLPALDVVGIHASQGSACSAGSPEPPRVLLELGLDARAAKQCVRFSVSHRTTLDEVHEASRRIVTAVGRLRTVASRDA